MERYTDNLKITDFIMGWMYDHKIVDVDTFSLPSFLKNFNVKCFINDRDYNHNVKLNILFKNH